MRVGAVWPRLDEFGGLRESQEARRSSKTAGGVMGSLNKGRYLDIDRWPAQMAVPLKKGFDSRLQKVAERVVRGVWQQPSRT